MNNELTNALYKLVSERASRTCPDHNCPYIKAAIIEMMVPYIEPLSQVIEKKSIRYADGGMLVSNFVSEVIYEVMSVMGKFAGTSVQTTMEVCSACNQAAAINKGEQH